MKRFIFRKDDYVVSGNAEEYINNLDRNKSWVIEVKRYRKKRSISQNAYIHAVPLKIIAEHTGYTVDEMKEYLCGEFMGWEEFTVMGRIRMRPIKTTSQMDAGEMTDFIEYLQWFGSSELNLYIPSPNEWVE